ncbi:MAG: glycosyltransferase [Muribaculaceae bacterium]|nr:glycosyltransferase [Muribaculaceae bacterium]MCM1398945.1 glycosyltransferase [Clostridium sp.]MCM1458803.1 glycosyltransferase [Bacteroides sp.]
MKKISVVVPCYNVSEYLDQCMEHLLNQTIGLENIEIILVDDASTDNGATLQVLKRYEQQFPDTIILIPLEQNVRQGGARNIGISYASGEYLMFCDADDWLAYQAMEILYNIAKEKDADVVEHPYKMVYDTSDSGEYIQQGNGSYLRIMDPENIKRHYLIADMENFTLGCWNKLYRMSLIKDNDIQFAPHLICEEPSFTLPVRLYEKKHVYVDAVLHYYLQRPTNTVNSDWNIHKFDNLQVWLILIEDVADRGFMKTYSDELEFMFFYWGFCLTIEIIIKKGLILTFDELQLLKNTLLESFPNIRLNPYIAKNTSELDSIYIKILDTPLTEELVKNFNVALQTYLFEKE